MPTYDDLKRDRERCDRAVPALEDGKIRSGRWGQSPARTLCKDKVRRGDEDDECRPGDCPEDRDGCGEAAVLLLLCLLLGACAPDEAFRVAFCGMPALVVGFVVLAWALWR